MSLFSDLANAIGHTVDSLAQEIGTGISNLEGVVNDLSDYGVDVFSAAAKLGLSPVDFLRSIVTFMQSDPHQQLLQRVSGPIQPMEEPLALLSQQWGQMAALHSTTAQAINIHIMDLFQSGGTSDYRGPAAETLWTTNQHYQHYFTNVLVAHAQVQQTRHTTLNGYTNDYLSRMPGKVYSLSAPVAAFGVLSLDMATAEGPSSVLDNPSVQWVEQQIEDTFQEGEEGLPPPSDPDSWPGWLILLVIIVVLVIILIIVVVAVAIWDGIQNHQNHQKNTLTPGPTPKPNAVASMADDLARQYNVPLSVIEDIINKNPGLTKDQYALLIQYYKKYGKYPFGVRIVFTGVDQNGNTRIYFITNGDMQHIREHPDQLQNLSDDELLALIQRLLQKDPDDVVINKGKQFVDYYYYDEDVNGKYITIDIRISTSTPGRIISVFERY